MPADPDSLGQTLLELRMSQTHELLPLAKAVLRTVTSPVASEVLAALDANHDSMLDIRCDPHGYTDARRFGVDYMAFNLLRKWDGWELSRDTADVALATFYSGEIRNGDINRHGYVPLAAPRFTEGRALSTRFAAIIMTARRIISETLGDFSWADASAYFGFSSGASYGLGRRFGDPSFKFTRGRPEVTRRAAIAAICDIQSCPVWAREMTRQFGCNPYDWIEIVDGSRFHLVDKDAKTMRGINIEPRMNMRIQKGIGELIRRKLLKRGVNLNSQTRNQEYAHQGSLDGSLATLDLENASGSICARVIWDLFPRDWADAMDMARCETAEMPDGTVHRFNMWSSMGNGYTFEMESLLFWALSKATMLHYDCVDKRLAVYGDDIVVPTIVAEPVIAVLGYCGFVTNASKTFYYGAFRESCGKHYFNGVDVTPVYYKSYDGTTLSACHVANSYRAWVSRFPDLGCNKTYNYLVKASTNAKGPKPGMVPDGYGLKSGIISSWDNATPWVTSNLSSRPLAYVFYTLSYESTEACGSEVGRYLACLESRPGTPLSPYERRLVRKGRMRSRKVYDPAWMDPARAGNLFVSPANQRLLRS